ncbi:DUF1203 domain-containing protein [Terrarubrum flagellatum]|uniref:DUF1203 domain-containing protein n=1 Tax=Terrirubrum flagellatum TaxID=2895980 RepID=UPI0031451D18
MNYRAVGLDPEIFAPFFTMSDDELRVRGATRMIADRGGAYPCRVSLKRADKGEELVLVNHEHRTAPHSPYRARGPIFVSRAATEKREYVGELPPMMREVMLSLRAYDERGFLVEGEICEGPYADRVLRRMLSDEKVAEVHAHFARQGCFAARFTRA